MTRIEISFFMKNVPGEFARLADLLRKEEIAIEAITVQDASAYVMELFKARGKTLKRVASTKSYESMQRDSNEFALVRILVDDTEKTADLLFQNGYIFDVAPVIAVHLDNHPGKFVEIASRLGDKGVNINYFYGSVGAEGDKHLFVFNVDDAETAEATLNPLAVS